MVEKRNLLIALAVVMALVVMFVFPVLSATNIYVPNSNTGNFGYHEAECGSNAVWGWSEVDALAYTSTNLTAVSDIATGSVKSAITCADLEDVRLGHRFMLGINESPSSINYIALTSLETTPGPDSYKIDLYIGNVTGTSWILLNTTFATDGSAVSLNGTISGVNFSELINQTSNGNFIYVLVATNSTREITVNSEFTLAYLDVNVSANPSIGLTRVYPTTDINATAGQFFNITVNVSCLGGVNCGEVNVSLDPAGVTSLILNSSYNLADINPDLGTFEGAPPLAMRYFAQTKWDISSALSLQNIQEAYYCNNLTDLNTYTGDYYNLTIILNQSWDESSVLADLNSFLRVNSTLVSTSSFVLGTVVCLNVTSQLMEAVSRQNNNFTLVVEDMNKTLAQESATTINDNSGLIIGGWLSTDFSAKYNDREGSVDANDLPYLNITYSSGKGLISTTSGATPFYTNESNPRNITLLAGESQLVTFWVNTTGTAGQGYNFFVYANATSNMSVSNVTSNWSVSIISAGGGPATSQILLDLLYPMSSSVNASLGQFFNVSVNVSCAGANCGEVNVSLDPDGITTSYYPNMSGGAGLRTGEDSGATLFGWDVSTWSTSYSSGDLDAVSALNENSVVSINQNGPFDRLGHRIQFNISESVSSLANLSFLVNQSCVHAAGNCDALDVYIGRVSDTSWVQLATQPTPSADYYLQYGSVSTSLSNYINQSDEGNFVYLLLFSNATNGFGGPTITHYLDFIQLNVTTNSKGLISTTIGATPFYTNESNPRNVTLNVGESQVITFWVNTTGSVGQNYTFFVFANKTSQMSISNTTSTWNVSIISAGGGGDITSPIVNLISPVNSSNFTTRTIWFASNFTDNSALLNATLYVWNSTNDLVNASENRTISGTSNSSNISVVLPAEGMFLWNYKVFDSSGNSAFNSTNWTLNVDSTAPALTINSPANNSNFTSSSVNFTITSSETLSWCGLSIDGTANVTMTIIGTTIGNYTNTSMTDGQHNFIISCNDSVNNFNLTERYALTVDTVAPAVTVVLPENRTHYSEDLPIVFNISVNENASLVNYTLDNGVNNYTMSSVDNRYWNASNASLATGSYTAKFYVWDLSNNANRTENVVFYFFSNNLTGCGVLNRANTAYYLGTNVSSAGTCFTISADNVSLDCRGFNVNYSNVIRGQGIYSFHKNNLSVRNCNLYLGNLSLNCSYGLYFYNTTNSLIENNNVTVNNSAIGVYNLAFYFNHDRNTTVRNNQINLFGPKNYAIYSLHGLLTSPSNLIIENNTIITSGTSNFGLVDYYPNGIRFSGNSLTMSGLGSQGINSFYSRLGGNITLSNNNINMTLNSTSQMGVYVYRTWNATLLNNNLSGAFNLLVSQSANAQVSGNVLRGFGLKTYGSVGLQISNSSNSKVIGNSITSTGKGIIVNNYGQNNIIHENNVSLPETGVTWAYGIYMGAGASRTNLTNNRVLSAPGIGFYLAFNSFNNTIHNNYINSSYFIPGYFIPNLAYSVSTADFNRSLLAGTNIISGTLLGGNFWATSAKTGFSQKCADVDANGICDSAYSLSSYHKDNLALTYIDVTAPYKAEIVYPENNSFVNGIVGVRADVADAVGIKYVQFQFKNSTVDWTNLTGCLDSSAPYVCYWNSGSLAFANTSEGYDIKAIAYDFVGNSASNVSHYVIDRLLPIVYDSEIIYPSLQTSARAGQIVQLRANVTDSPYVASGINDSVVNASLLNFTGTYQPMNLIYGSLGAGEESIWEKNLTVNSSSNGYVSTTVRASDRAVPTANLRLANSYWRVYVDNSAPTYSSLSVLSADELIYNNTDAVFSLLAEDNYKLARYVFSTNASGAWVNDSAVSFNGQTSESLSVVKRVTSGVYGYRVYLYDDAGNENETGIQMFSVETTTPDYTLILLDGPNDLSAFNSANVSFAYSYTGDLFDNCTLTVDGADNLTTASPLNYSSLSFQQNFSDGTYSWGVICERLEIVSDEENSSRVYQSDTRTFLVDSAKPSVKINFPSNSSYRESQIVFNTSAYDRVDSCVASINNWASNYTMSAINSTLYNLTIPLTLSGSYIGRVSCNNSAGNANSTESVSFSVDFVHPEVYLNLTNNTNTNASSIDFRANFTDDVMLANATLYIWNLTGELVNSTFVSISGSSNSSAINVSLPASGSYLWNYLVFDSLGNSGVNRTNYTLVYSYADVYAPVINSFSATPATGSVYVSDASYVFRLNISDYSSINKVLFEFNGSNYSASNSSLNIFNVSFRDFVPGVYSYRVFANDSLGNMNSSFNGSYTLAKGTPSGSLSFSPSNSIRSGTASVVTGSESNEADGDVVYSLTRASVGVSNPDSASLGSGSYAYVYSSSAGQNWSVTSLASASLTVSSGGSSGGGSSGGGTGSGEGGDNGDEEGSGEGGNSTTICVPQYSCVPESVCINGKRAVRCTDLQCSQASTNSYVSCELKVCSSNWQCTPWTTCSEGVSTRECFDLKGCGSAKPSEKMSCEVEEVCTPDVRCEDSSSCSYSESVSDILHGNVLSTGTKTSSCRDLNGCISDYDEKVSCVSGVNLTLEEIDVCGNRKLVAMNKDSRTPLALVGLNEWNNSLLSVSFVQALPDYCFKCYNSVQDSNEEGVDCGGECRSCSMQGIDWLKFIIWLLWLIILICLIFISREIYKNRHELRMWFNEWKYSLKASFSRVV